jgi:hypothetical protein
MEKLLPSESHTLCPLLRTKDVPPRDSKARPPATLTSKACATLYDVVGSVKRHVGFAGRERLVFFFPKRNSFLSLISTKARFVNLAVESGSTSHLFGHQLPTMIRSSEAAIARGSKVPNQPSDPACGTRVAPGLPCMRTSRA